MLNCPIILASSSPRRIQLLQQAGLSVIVQAPNVDETPRRGESPRAMVARLAREKAESLMMPSVWQHGAALILAADTTVVAPGGRAALGKPVDTADAVKMVKKLAGKTHTVLTGYCWLSVAREMKPERIVRVVSTRVTMRPMTRAMVERYVATGESIDKAGAYAAQGVGATLIEKITGSYTNVIGLPITQVLMDLERKFGVTALGGGA